VVMGDSLVNGPSRRLSLESEFTSTNGVHRLAVVLAGPVLVWIGRLPALELRDARLGDVARAGSEALGQLIDCDELGPSARISHRVPLLCLGLTCQRDQHQQLSGRHLGPLLNDRWRVQSMGANRPHLLLTTRPSTTSIHNHTRSS